MAHAIPFAAEPKDEPRVVSSAVLPELGVNPELPQRRWTVAIRFFLVLPCLLWTVLLTIAATLVRVVAWVAALILGRLPQWSRNFLSSYLIYATRVSGYLMLLTDVHPGFALPRPNAGRRSKQYPVAVVLPEATALNRWAVFFRELLAVPMVLLVSVLTAGWAVAAPILWLLTIAYGRAPKPVAGANAAIVRIMLRTQAYVFLLTPEYLKAPLGDTSGPYADNFHPSLKLSISTGARRLMIGLLVLGVAANVLPNILRLIWIVQNPSKIGTADQNAAVQTLHEYYADVADSRGDAACELLTPRLAETLTITNKAPNCPAAIVKSADAQGMDKARSLSNFKFFAPSVEVSSDRTYATITTNAIYTFNGLTTGQNALIVFVRADAKQPWRIASLG